MLDVPGMGSITGLRWRSQAIAIWVTLALCSRAKSAMGWLAVGSDEVVCLIRLCAALPPMGYQGRKAMLCSSQNLRVDSESRLSRLYLFWTLTIGTIFCAASICAGVTSER